MVVRRQVTIIRRSKRPLAAAARPIAAARMTGVALVALTCLASTSARAVELWSRPDEGSSLELRGFYKSYGTFLLVPDALVRETAALEQLREAAALQRQLPAGASVAIPREVGLSTNTLRLWSKLALGAGFEVNAGWQIAATTASPALLGASGASSGGGGLGSAMPSVGAAGASRRRLVDFNPVLAQTNGLLLQHNLDLLSVKVGVGKGELVAGRQVLSWGTGRFWNPADLLSPFAPTDVDKEVRHGVDALRFSTPLSATSLVDVLWLPQKRGVDQGGVARVQANAKGFDFSLSVAKYVSDVVIGADTAGDIGPLGVHGEAAYTQGLTGLGAWPADEPKRFVRAVAGVEWRPGSDWIVEGEYYFNGYGTSDPSRYLAVLSRPRAQRGEVFGAGRHYLGLAGIWKASDLLTVNASMIANLQDPSAMLFPTLEYWFEQSVIVRAGAFLPLGRSPDPRGVQALTAADLSDQTERFRAATTTMGLQSEYGTSSAGLFAQLGIYF